MSDQRLLHAWDNSYDRRENYLFWPSDEAIKFFARYLRRRIRFDNTVNILPSAEGSRMLDVGCGVGRYLIFGTEMGMEMHGTDLSMKAVEQAQAWLEVQFGIPGPERVIQGDIRALPWEDSYFAHAMSDSVLDCMPFEVAQSGVIEIARVMRAGGYFYSNFTSGIGVGGGSGFCGETVVQDEFAHETIRSYFDLGKIQLLLNPLFEIIDCTLIQMAKQGKGIHYGRWHVVSRCR